MRALILVDIQNDFCPGGSLAVEDGDWVVPIANELIPKFDIKVRTQDHHPSGHLSFIEQGGPWPPHCVQGTHGADFHSALLPVGKVFPKGTLMGEDSYSGFADGGNPTGLDMWLRTSEVDELYIMGLATDYCVKATVLDALKLDYKVFVVIDGCRGVNIHPDDSRAAITAMAHAGAVLINSSEVL